MNLASPGGSASEVPARSLSDADAGGGSGRGARFQEWVTAIRHEFSDLSSHETGEILDAVLDPAYSTHLPPEGSDEPISVTVTRLKVKNVGDNRGRVHTSHRCSEISAIDRIASLKTTAWKATQGRDACAACVVDPTLLACDAIRGETRRRIEIRTEIILALRAMLNGSTDWTAVSRLAVHSANHILPRNTDGFLDMGDPVIFEPDPAGQAMVEMMVRIGRARQDDIAALTDAAVVFELGNERAQSKGGAIKAVDAAIDRVLATGSELDGKSGMLNFAERKISNLINDALLEASIMIETELANLEDGGYGLIEWSKELANGDARPEHNIQARMAMAFHGGLVPAVIVDVLNQTGWNGALTPNSEDGPRQRW